MLNANLLNKILEIPGRMNDASLENIKLKSDLVDKDTAIEKMKRDLSMAELNLISRQKQITLLEDELKTVKQKEIDASMFDPERDLFSSFFPVSNGSPRLTIGQENDLFQNQLKMAKKVIETKEHELHLMKKVVKDQANAITTLNLKLKQNEQRITSTNEEFALREKKLMEKFQEKNYDKSGNQEDGSHKKSRDDKSSWKRNQQKFEKQHQLLLQQQKQNEEQQLQHLQQLQKLEELQQLQIEHEQQIKELKQLQLVQQQQKKKYQKQLLKKDVLYGHPYNGPAEEVVKYLNNVILQIKKNLEESTTKQKELAVKCEQLTREKMELESKLEKLMSQFDELTTPKKQKNSKEILFGKRSSIQESVESAIRMLRATYLDKP